MKTLGGTKLLLFSVCIGVVSLTRDQVSANSKPSVKILVIGQTGSGKSTLINILLRRYIAPVGHSLSRETEKVSVYQKEINGVSVTACDTPGLRDASGQDRDYMNKIKVSCDNPDLVLFCMRMDTPRWQNDDSETIKIITEYLGKHIWEHSLLVLTHADKVVDRNIPVDKQNVSFNERNSEFKEKFITALKNAGVSRHSIPVAVSAKLKYGERLPGIKNWMAELLVNCLAQSKASGKGGLLQLVIGRMLPEEIDEADCENPEYQQDFIFTESLCSFLKLHPGLWTGGYISSKLGMLLGGKLLGAKLGSIFGGPIGGFLGLVGGYALEQILSTITCPSSMNDEKPKKVEL